MATGRTVERMLTERRHPEYAYRACLGLLALAKRYGKPRLEAASLIALELGTTKVAHVVDDNYPGLRVASPENVTQTLVVVGC